MKITEEQARSMVCQETLNRSTGSGTCLGRKCMAFTKVILTKEEAHYLEIASRDPSVSNLWYCAKIKD